MNQRGAVLPRQVQVLDQERPGHQRGPGCASTPRPAAGACRRRRAGSPYGPPARRRARAAAVRRRAGVVAPEVHEPRAGPGGWSRRDGARARRRRSRARRPAGRSPPDPRPSRARPGRPARCAGGGDPSAARRRCARSRRRRGRRAAACSRPARPAGGQPALPGAARGASSPASGARSGSAALEGQPVGRCDPADVRRGDGPGRSVHAAVQPRAVEGREHLERRAGAAEQRPGRDRVRRAGRAELSVVPSQRVRDPRVAPASVRPEVRAHVHRRGVDLGGQPRDHVLRPTLEDAQPRAAAVAQLAVQVGERGGQPGRPSLPRGAPQDGVRHEQRQDGRTLVDGGAERRVVGEPEVASHPPDHRRVRTGHVV